MHVNMRRGTLEMCSLTVQTPEHMFTQLTCRATVQTPGTARLLPFTTGGPILASFIIICEMKTSLVHTVKEIKCSSSPEMSYTILIDHRAEGGRTITWRHPELRCTMMQFKEKEAIRRTICELGGFSSETQTLNASVSERQTCLSWQQSS